MKRYIVFLLMLSFLLTGCITLIPGQTGTDPNSVKDTSEETSTVAEPTGWVSEAAQTFYVHEDGKRHIGWLELDGKRYYLDNKGVLQTGWLEQDGNTYYLQDDGSVTCGKATVDSRVHYFSSTGAKILLVNPWNMMPSDYSPILKEVENGMLVEKSCRDSLTEMLAACRSAGHQVKIISAYRERSTQITLYNNKVNYFLDKGYDAATARAEAGKVVAMPGTSEHELGLAVDLVDEDYTALDEAQENTDTQKWLMAHCWEYGFVLRYPNNKSQQTGIIYEPWHYRYVGKAVAKELQTLGLCLEEYFDKLS